MERVEYKLECVINIIKCIDFIAIHSISMKVRPTSHGYYRTGKNGQHEHRKVYEDYIGRKLESTEIIHHINFNRTDNRIENLYLYSNVSEHQKVHAEHRRLLKELKDDEIIKFENGRYVKFKL